MKRSMLINILICAVTIMMFSGCDAADYMLDDVLYYSPWRDDVVFYSYDIIFDGYSKYKKIDYAHKKAFDSVFEDIEIFGAKLCMPMKVSELPDKFELYDYVGGADLFVPDDEEVGESGWFPVSEIEHPKGTYLIGGMKKYSLILFYEGEIGLANVLVICKENQSIEDGIIYEIDGYFSDQLVLLGGKVDFSSDINEIKEFLGEGNEFLRSYSNNYLDLIYTDGDRMIRLDYSINGEDIHFIHGYIETIEMYK